MSFLHPCDRRWQGPAQWFLYLDLVKNTVLFFFVILVIVEGALYRYWYMNYHSTAEFDSSETAAEWFVRIGLALILDILSTISTHTLLHKNPVRLQPIFALTQSLIVFCLYPSALFLNLIITYSDETGYTYIDAWQRLCYAEMGMQGLLAVCWAGMVGCSCVAVHKWRGEKKLGAITQGLKLKDDGRKDSGNLEVERDGSVKSAIMFV